nr:hypothetical protein CFP56_04039 [Quercus suber]
MSDARGPHATVFEANGEPSLYCNLLLLEKGTDIETFTALCGDHLDDDLARRDVVAAARDERHRRRCLAPCCHRIGCEMGSITNHAALRVPGRRRLRNHHGFLDWTAILPCPIDTLCRIPISDGSSLGSSRICPSVTACEFPVIAHRVTSYQQRDSRAASRFESRMRKPLQGLSPGWLAGQSWSGSSTKVQSVVAS